MSGLPSITITFTSAARAVSRRAGQGIVAMVLTDAGSNTAGIYHIAAEADIPEGLGVNNKAYIARALTGNVNRPAKIIALVKTSSTTMATALASLALYDFDWIVGDPDLSTADAATIKTWIATQRADYDKIYKAVLPNVAADSESIVNFAAEDIKVGSTTYDTEAFCSRIAGIIAGTPLKQSITKVQLGRGITSLTTTTNKSKLLKKIKLSETLDIIKRDLRVLTQDNYIGKLANSYDNKVVLISAYLAYLKELEAEGILQSGKSTMEIDIDAQRAYLKARGDNVADMTDDEIKTADTDEQVFIRGSIRMLDAIEDVAINMEF